MVGWAPGEAPLTLKQGQAKLVKAGSVLYTVRENGQPFAMRPKSETEFFYETVGATVTFELDANGKVTAMLFHLPEGTQRAPRE